MTALEVLKKVRSEMRPHAKAGEYELPVILKAMHDFAALRQPPVVGRSEQFYCTCSRAKGLDHDEEGMPYCIECQKPVQ